MLFLFLSGFGLATYDLFKHEIYLDDSISFSLFFQLALGLRAWRSRIVGLFAKDVAALLFDHLVTPSGTKIAHEAADLAKYAGATQSDVMPVLAKLGEERILRSVEGSGGRDSRYEIFHDVLAEPVLAWKASHETSRALEAAAEVEKILADSMASVLGVDLPVRGETKISQRWDKG